MNNKKGLLFFVFLMVFFLSAQAQNGILDLSFNGTGKIDASYETANSITTDNNNNVLVLGHDRSSATLNIFLNRYLPNGTPDSSFGVNGRFLFDMNSDYDYGRCVKALSDGKYLISGQNSTGP